MKIQLLIILLLSNAAHCETIFKSSFGTSSAVIYQINGIDHFINGCQVDEMNITDSPNAHLIDYYVFTCVDNLPGRIQGTDVKAIGIINGEELFCKVDYFQFFNNTNFSVIFDCN